MRGKFVITITMLLLLISPFLSLGIEGQTTDKITITIPGEEPRFVGADPLVITGIFHNISIELSTTPSIIEINMSYDGDKPILNETNSYQWNYNGTFNDVKYDDFFINQSSCSVTGNIYNFWVGVYYYTNQGNWNLTVDVDGVEKWNKTVVLQLGTAAGLAVSAPTFYFEAIPYEEGILDPTASQGYFRTINSCNVPVTLVMEYELYQPFFNITNISGNVHIGEERKHYATFSVPPWSPLKVTFQIWVLARPVQELLVDPLSNVYFSSQAGRNIWVNVQVARKGFEIIDLGDIKVQYKDTKVADYDEEISLEIYLTGTVDTNLVIVPVNITLSAVTLDNVEVDMEIPVLMSLSEDVEKHVVMNITCDTPDVTAVLKYMVESTDHTTSGECFTEIFVGAAPNVPVDDSLFLSLIGLGFIIGCTLIVILFLARAYRNKKINSKRTISKRRPKSKNR